MPRVYHTDFPSTEIPVSENGNWISGKAVGIDWADIVTVPGLAMGSGGAVPFSDPTALLTGPWGPDQTVQAAVRSRNPTESYCQEVEIRLRSSLSPHRCTGYEILFRCSKTAHAYMEIVRWEGPLAGFTYLLRRKGPEFGVEEGDTVQAAIIGNTIKVYINGRLIGKVADDVFKTGTPGIGFNYGCEGTYGDFGLTSFSATDGS